MPRHSQRFWLAAFVVAWAVDFLFWGKPAGISYLVFVLLALLAGYLLAWDERASVSRASLVLSAMLVVLAAITVLRSEAFTRVLNGFLAICGLGLLAMTFRSGRWTRFRMLDYVFTAFELFITGLVCAANLRLFPEGEAGSARRGLRKAAPLLRGLLLALPVVLLLGALLASADLVFADQLGGLLKIFDLSRLPEYLFRLVYILALAYAFAGLYMQAVAPTRWGMAVPKLAQQAASPSSAAVDSATGNAASTPAAGAESQHPVALAEAEQLASGPGVRLGSTEAFVVLGSVDLLFAFFVGVQFRYLFGGHANITAAGYTYSEYARRGFFELVLVAVISLLLYLGLNAITRRERPIQARVFTGLAVLLVGLVWVILASAFQRLLLYEDAYGFTNLRTYTHIFIPWLGFLLLGTIVLQLIRREQFFGALLLLTTFGFALTFGVINIDGLIVRQNVARARAGADLDGQYLIGLSEDALPALVQEFNAPEQTQAIRGKLGAVLACRIYDQEKEDPKQPAWQSYHIGKAAAWQAIKGLDLSAYPVQVTGQGPRAMYGREELNCYPKRSLD